MTINSAPDVAVAERPKTVFDSSAAVFAAVDAVAAAARPDAARRDRHRLHPAEPLGLLERSGLLALTVPREFGGFDAPTTVLVEVVRRLAVVDASLAQLTLPTFVTAHFIRELGDGGQQRRWFAELLDGGRFGNATVDKRGAGVEPTTLRRTPDGLRLTGTKYYATGARGAGRVLIAAVDEAGAQVIALIDGDAPGLTVVDDWNSFGQRGTYSGTVLFDQVPVAAEDVLPAAAAFGPTSLFEPFDQALHAAVDVGVGRGAVDAATEFLAGKANPATRYGVQDVREDPFLLYLLGRTEIQVSAAERLLEHAARAVDDIPGPPRTAEAVAAAVFEVNKAKVFAASAAVDAASAIVELSGTSATDEQHGLDRYWRDARTHTVHDPARWRQRAVGAYALETRYTPEVSPSGE